MGDELSTASGAGGGAVDVTIQACKEDETGRTAPAVRNNNHGEYVAADNIIALHYHYTILTRYG